MENYGGKWKSASGAEHAHEVGNIFSGFQATCIFPVAEGVEFPMSH